MLEPNPWFSRHLAASEERDGLIRKLSSLEQGGNLLERLGSATDDQKLCRFLQQAETALDEQNKLTEDFPKGQPVRSFSSSTGDLLSSLALGNAEMLRQRMHKISTIGFRDIKGDSVADEDWKMITRAEYVDLISMRFIVFFNL